MFEIFTKEVEIKGEKYTLRPLSGRHLPKFFKVLKALEGSGKTADDFLTNLDEESMGLAHELCLETLKASYPDKEVALLDQFVTQNLLQMMPVLVEVNLPDNVSTS